MAWVRRHDAVIVPGMGVLETSLPLPTWEFPYAMFLLGGSSGDCSGRKSRWSAWELASSTSRVTRWLFNAAARFAYYRSYRNTRFARGDAAARPRHHARPCLIPTLRSPSRHRRIDPGDPQIVCVGVMEYHGSNDDREHADEIRSSYVDGMKRFVRWLVDHDRKVRLLIGDTNGSDELVVEEILADLRESRPDLDPSRVDRLSRLSPSPTSCRRCSRPGSVVAIRFHNVLGALKLGKPTIAISYSPKHDALMADMGVPEFCQPVHPFDFDLLIQRFTELEGNVRRS